MTQACGPHTLLQTPKTLLPLSPTSSLHSEANHAHHEDPRRQDPQTRLRQDPEDVQDRLRQEGQFFSLPALAKTYPGVSRLPVSIRIVLESVLRNCDGKRVTAEHVAQLANWQPSAERTEEIPFVVARIVLQDFTGVPLLVDLAAMRTAAQAWARTPRRIEPLVPVDLVVDHSVQVDYYGTQEALDLNMELEFQRNRERYQFLKWGMQAFDTFGVVPPGIGIVHQVNLEYLAQGVHKSAMASTTRHAGGHRLAHDDDQRHRRGGLGRGRHRGRGRHAGPAGLLPDARRGGRGTHRRAARRCHRHRSGAHRHRDAAQGKGRRQVRRVLRRRRAPLALPTAPPSPTWRPSTAPPWASSRWTRSTIDYFVGTGRTKDESSLRGLLQGAGAVRHAAGDGDIDYTSVVELDLGTVVPSRWPARSGRRTASSSAT